MSSPIEQKNSQKSPDEPELSTNNDEELPKYEDVIKTSAGFELTPDDVQVSYNYAASVASSNDASSSADHYIHELEVFRNNRHLHVTVGCTNPTCHQQSSRSSYAQRSTTTPYQQSDERVSYLIQMNDK